MTTKTTTFEHVRIGDVLMNNKTMLLAQDAAIGRRYFLVLSAEGTGPARKLHAAEIQPLSGTKHKADGDMIIRDARDIDHLGLDGQINYRIILARLVPLVKPKGGSVTVIRNAAHTDLFSRIATIESQMTLRRAEIIVGDQQTARYLTGATQRPLPISGRFVQRRLEDDESSLTPEERVARGIQIGRKVAKRKGQLTIAHTFDIRLDDAARVPALKMYFPGFMLEDLATPQCKTVKTPEFLGEAFELASTGRLVLFGEVDHDIAQTYRELLGRARNRLLEHIAKNPDACVADNDPGFSIGNRSCIIKREIK